MHRFVRVTAFGLLCAAFALSACSPEPEKTRCGDGVKAESEACDDGNTTNGDGCEDSCTVTETSQACGNGAVDEGESCDDGNTDDTDGCKNDCTAPTVDAGKPAVCGDGAREGHELCDDGNQDDADACKNDCSLPPPGPFCGDGTTNGTEACDDGNSVNGDGCELDCTATVAADSASVCGDGTRQTPEMCDDGNGANGDGCETDCLATALTEVSCPAASMTISNAATCEVAAGDGNKLIIGTLLMPGKVLKGGQVLVGADGNIACVGCDCSAQAAFKTSTKVFCGANVVTPGLINSHDHLTFDADPYQYPGAGPDGRFPDGGIPERYEHRHDWRQGNDGHTMINNGGGSAAGTKWNELRQLMVGTTAISGSGGTNGLLRNLDAPDHSTGTGDDQEQLGANSGGGYYQVFPLREGANEVVGSCAYGSNRDDPSDIPADAMYLPHIAEGIEESAHNEFLCMSGLQAGGHDMLTDRTAIVHGIAIKPAEIRLISSKSSSLVWSPRSNMALYGETASVTIYARSRVNIALGTDWTRSGSMHMLRELQCADYLNSSFYDRYFSDESLWRMVTVNAARAGFVQTRTGMLANGFAGDIAVFKYTAGNPYRTVIAAHTKDVILTLRGGKALYGDTNVLNGIGSTCETLDVCSVQKTVCLTGELGESLATLSGQNTDTYPLFFCDGAPEGEPVCTPMRGASWLFSGANAYSGISTTADADGDGLEDAQDNCPDVFNPKRPMDNGVQGDADGDTVGDRCDICPLTANATTCTAFVATDIDGDGTANGTDNCPAEPNSAQTDTDSDLKGDACDVCPTQANPGAQPCPAPVRTIYELKDIAGTYLNQKVGLQNALVTATEPNGFVMQVHENDTGYTGADYSGIYAYYPAPSGSPAVRTDIKVGDRVTIPSATLSLFPTAAAALLRQTQLSGIAAGSVTVVSSNNAMPAFTTATVAELTTGGSRSVALEGVLVQVLVASATDLNPPPAGGDTAPTNEFTVSQTSGGPQLRVDDLFHLITPPPTANETFAYLRGVLLARRDHSKLEPRSALDYSRPPAVASVGPAGQFVRIGTTQVPTIPQAIKVRLNSVQATDTIVTLTSDASVSVPATVTVTAGQLEATIPVQGLIEAAAATINAAVGAQTPVSQTVRVISATAVPTMVTLTPDPASVAAGGTVQMTATLDLPPTTDTDLAMTVAPGTTFGTTMGTVTVLADQISQTFTFAADATATGSGSVTATFGSVTDTAVVNIVSNTATGLVINEFDYDQEDADTAEFIEVLNPTSSAISLVGLQMSFINGSDQAEYRNVALDSGGATTLAPGEYLVLRTAAVVVPTGTKTIDLSASGGWLQNGPDAIGILDTASGMLIDSVSYEDATTAGITSGGRVYREGGSTATLVDTNDLPLESIARKTDGVDTDDNAADFEVTETITPGAANP